MDDLPVILIVEDDPPIQSIVEDALSDGGFEPAVAPSGEEAVTLLKGRPHGQYCLSYDAGGTDCSFTRYAQCEAEASGQGAECYGNTCPCRKPNPAGK